MYNVHKWIKARVLIEVNYVVREKGREKGGRSVRDGRGSGGGNKRGSIVFQQYVQQPIGMNANILGDCLC